MTPFFADVPLMLSLAVTLGLISLLLARAAKIPGIVILLVAGVAFGPDGIGWIDPRILGSHLRTLVGAAVAIILFEGGLQLQIASLRRNQKVIRRLISSGALLTAAGSASIARWVLGWDWNLCVLFGTLVIVTGPTVVSPLLKRIRVKKDLHTVLQAEGVLIDPIGALIAVVTLDFVLGGTTIGAAAGVIHLAMELGFGALAGAAGGAFLTWILRRPYLVPDDFVNIVTLGVVLLLYHGSNSVFHEGGIMVVTIAGMVVGNAKLPSRRSMLEFKEQLTHLLIGLLFILLTANTRIADVVALGWRGPIVVLGIMFVVRPLVVIWSSRGSGLSFRKQAFMSWLAPRGIVAAAVASIFGARLEAAGIPGGPSLQALVFLVIATTVISQGLSADLLAGLLRLRLPRENGAVVIGANALARLFASRFLLGEEDVVLIDNNPVACNTAEAAGLRVIYGNAMDASVLRRSRVNTRRIVIAMTENAGINLEALRKARHLSKDVGLFLTQATQDIDEPTLRSISAKGAFAGPIDVGYWSQLIERDQTSVVSFVRSGEAEGAELDAAFWLVHRFDVVALAITVKGVLHPVQNESFAKLPADAVLTLVVNRLPRTEVVEALAARGWTKTLDSQVASDVPQRLRKASQK